MRTKSKVVATRPPANFDEVKRRFIRQNRELAKNNSNQSLRIRSLELEVSKLLAENHGLREDVYRLQREAGSQTASTVVSRIKDELQAKLAELDVLVKGLDGAQTEAGLAQESTSGERAPLQGPWRERQPLLEAMRDSQMPTILEDKSFPRRTLGADEISVVRLSGHSDGSPDIGPPPIAHFDDEDPVKNASPSRPPAQDDELPTSMSVNLETRRKRRDGQPKLEIRRHSILAQSPEKLAAESTSLLRTGAKRKLADRDLDKTAKPLGQADFTFSRRASAAEPREADGAPHDSVEADVAPLVVADAGVPILEPVRKVLGEKSVNMSPRKTAARPAKGAQEVPDKPAPHVPRATSSARTQTRFRRTSAIPLPLPTDEVLPTVEIDVEPIPASTSTEDPPSAPSLFSPTPDPVESRDTPPPGDLSNLSMLSTATDGTSRPSRRARAAVNYAEPSLMAKMRRPEKKMVDALSGLQDPRRVMSASSAVPSSRPVIVKAEPMEDEDAWKSFPEVEPVHADGGDDESLPIAEPRAALDDSAAPPAVILKPPAPGRRRTVTKTVHTVAETSPEILLATQRLGDLDIYDFKGSSSPVSSTGKGAPVTENHRRHSSVPKNGAQAAKYSDSVEMEKARLVSADVIGIGPGRSERAASRRRSMML